MARTTRALTAGGLGAWLVKAQPGALPITEVLDDGFATVTSRCVRPSYRTDLVEAGQPVLLWVSGGDRRHPSGIYASGETTGPVRQDDSELTMPVRFGPLAPVVLRTELLGHPLLREIEVVRMPAGSNPSYLDTAQYRTLRQAFPQVHLGWSP